MNSYKVSQLDKKKLLERASNFIFSSGIGDAASQLCKLNMRYGLAQMHLIQEKYGFEPKAHFISTPDETISRNNYRWYSGYGYGGRISWGSSNDKIIFLNVKPNQCGILVGALQELIDYNTLIQRINDIKAKQIYHKDILLDWDLGVSNHFLNIFETINTREGKFPPYMFLIHGSAPEIRDDTYGLGMYVDKSEDLRNMAIKEETPFGIQYILLDSAAKEYFKLNDKAVKFSLKKREIIADHIFGNDYEVVCNQAHQFLKDYNNIYLGSNCTDTRSKFVNSNIFPITLRADYPAYIVEGKNNFSEDSLQKLNFFKRAEALEMIDLLKDANILPHGSGYSFPDIKGVAEVIEEKFQRYFVCNLKKSQNGLKIIRSVSDLQFEYRREEVISKTIQLDLGTILMKLEPKYSIK